MNEKDHQDTNHAMSFEEFLQQVENCLHPAWLNSSPERKAWRTTYAEELQAFFDDPPPYRVTPQGMAGALESGLL